MALLEQKSRFEIKNAKASNRLAEDNLFRWTAGNFFRTSYNDMSDKVSLFLILRNPFPSRAQPCLDIRASCLESDRHLSTENLSPSRRETFSSQTHSTSLEP